MKDKIGIFLIGFWLMMLCMASTCSILIVISWLITTYPYAAGVSALIISAAISSVVAWDFVKDEERIKEDNE